MPAPCICRCKYAHDVCADARGTPLLQQRSYGRWRLNAKKRSRLSKCCRRKARRPPSCRTVMMMKRMRYAAAREACTSHRARMALSAGRVQRKDGVSLPLSRGRAHACTLACCIAPSVSLSLAQPPPLSSPSGHHVLCPRAYRIQACMRTRTVRIVCYRCDHVLISVR